MVQATTADLQAAIAAASDKFCAWKTLGELREVRSSFGPYQAWYLQGRKFTGPMPDPGPPPAGVAPHPCTRDPFSRFVPILVGGVGAAAFAGPLLSGGAGSTAGAAAAPVATVSPGAAFSLPSLGSLKTGIAAALSAAKSLGFGSGTGSSGMNLDEILSTTNGGDLPDWLKTAEDVAGSLFGHESNDPARPAPAPAPAAALGTLGWIVPVAIVGVILALALSVRRSR